MKIAEEVAALREEIADLRKRLEASERWQSWAAGLFGGGAAVLWVFLKGVLKKLGLD